MTLHGESWLVWPWESRVVQVGFAAVAVLVAVAIALEVQPGPKSQAFFGTEHIGRFGELRTTEQPGDPEHGGWGIL